MTRVYGQGSESRNSPGIEIKPFVRGGQNVRFYKVEETLNLTCSFKNETFLPNVKLSWIPPQKVSSSTNHVVTRFISNHLVLTIENLQENDSGDYKCVAVHNGIPYFISENTVKISVKNKKKDCSDSMLQCSVGICIPKRYTCDGVIDCHNGEDESPTHCGPGNPCDNKLMCPDNRCIPFSWCCELHRESNCTTKNKPMCCSHVEKLTRDVDNDLGYQFDQQRFNDMGFLQTTVYTVIGCAMAFMFIVTIIVIAICRVHVRRTLLSRCPTVNRNMTLGRGDNSQMNQLNGLSFYDLDQYFNRSGLSRNNLMSINPLLVTYNINNGVQFVGRPVDPPPYCEIVTSPPKEGPPPPYVSHEDLTNEDKLVEEPKSNDILDVCSEAETSEFDALLGESEQVVSGSSHNTADIVVIASEPPAMEVLPYQQNPEELNFSSHRQTDHIYKDGLESLENNETSQNAITAGKSEEYSKNTDVDILVVSGSDPVVSDHRPESLKIQSGESSSYVSCGVTDSSQGAIKKIAAVKSLDGGPKRRTKNFSKGHFRKF
ncbi:hypothetical protein RUM44_001574 [Polyplax serrata]|uniref:Ig-like domain-containing protein n=1 Tax=Polyplax serrata TaxID=468196 RepID=A0ABR1AKF1_POLSC